MTVVPPGSHRQDAGAVGWGVRGRCGSADIGHEPMRLSRTVTALSFVLCTPLTTKKRLKGENPLK